MNVVSGHGNWQCTHCGGYRTLVLDDEDGHQHFCEDCVLQFEPDGYCTSCDAELQAIFDQHK